MDVPAGFSPTLILVLNLAGTFVFGLSGGLAAVRAKLDLFGVVVLAAVVGLAGGITRDVLIGTAPATFRDWRYLAAGNLPLQTASEDFSDIPNALSVPYTYWGIGGIDPDTFRRAADAGRISQDIPVNHSPTFAPVLQPTLDTGTQAMVVAALAWLT